MAIYFFKEPAPEQAAINWQEWARESHIAMRHHMFYGDDEKARRWQEQAASDSRQARMNLGIE